MDDLTLLQRVVRLDPDDPVARLQLADEMESRGLDGGRRRIATALGGTHPVPDTSVWPSLRAHLHIGIYYHGVVKFRSSVPDCHERKLSLWKANYAHGNKVYGLRLLGRFHRSSGAYYIDGASWKYLPKDGVWKAPDHRSVLVQEFDTDTENLSIRSYLLYVHPDAVDAWLPREGS